MTNLRKIASYFIAFVFVFHVFSRSSARRCISALHLWKMQLTIIQILSEFSTAHKRTHMHGKGYCLTSSHFFSPLFSLLCWLFTFYFPFFYQFFNSLSPRKSQNSHANFSPRLLFSPSIEGDSKTHLNYYENTGEIELNSTKTKSFSLSFLSETYPNECVIRNTGERVTCYLLRIWKNISCFW